MSLKLEKQTDNIEGDWSLLSGDHFIACPGTYDSATVKLQAGVLLDDGTVLACADIADLTFTSEPVPFVASLCGDDFVYRWVITGAGASTEVTPIAGKVRA